ncbi:MAG: hypothetical protein RBQ94_00150 [Methanimicrococcus sp.]|jgi:hypothetical protein|nr:hypothetical protein [Methanimicrococcus sp.]
MNLTNEDNDVYEYSGYKIVNTTRNNVVILNEDNELSIYPAALGDKIVTIHVKKIL